MSLETGFEKSVYGNWSEYCKMIIQTNSIHNFKNHPNIEYMTEHYCLANYVPEWYKTIQQICLENFITDDIIRELLQLNEKLGSSYKNSTVLDVSCNGNSVRYVYMALLTYNYLKQRDNIHFVEIGGGYGGYAVVVNKLFEKMGKTISSYTMIDIENVIDVQQRYVSELISTNHFKFVQNTKLEELHPDSFLYSSYSLSEIDKQSRSSYYETVFKYIHHGMLFWNSLEIDLPQHYQQTVVEEKPKTGPYNRIVYFTM